MNQEATQQPLFDDPIGLQLRRSREQQGLSPEQVGQQLRLPLAIVEAMEREDWDRLGAPVYVRSYLGSYLRLLGLPESLAEPVIHRARPPELVSMASQSRLRHSLDRGIRSAVYLVMTAVLVVPVVLVVRHFQSVEPPAPLTLEPEVVLERPETLASGGSQSLPLPARDAGTTAAGANDVGPDPVMASIAPMPAPAPAADTLVLRFHGESWIEVLDAKGERMERALIPAGEERSYDIGRVANVTVGNADAVEVRVAGRELDLEPFRSANVARFAVSSDGEVSGSRR
ncbi:helix-turn-helix domain-containing protein [Arenimonas fontis]|uniref:DUF4115 domain-containing protein n=1 Tax=Arenimonas fontis TaxID=2608255 RepID=A0A5B2ZFK0_9GAMM|nr:helix-turn-helix domain-containing protein [Arenimonas fontis]KAA2285974.1 DUF4115 domain-containing protein [Arenimonas fontis]